MTRTDHEVAQGAELAIGLNISGDLTTAVLKHARAASLPLKSLVVLSVPNHGRDALRDPADVLGWAHAVTREMRTLAEEGHPRLHLPVRPAHRRGSARQRLESDATHADLG